MAVFGTYIYTMSDSAIGTVPSTTDLGVDVRSHCGHAEEVVGLFDQTRDRLMRYLLGLRLTAADAEEIVQEVFLALFRHLERERSCRNTRAWVFQVAHNLALKCRDLDRRNRQHLSPFETGSAAGAAAASTPNPEEQFLRNQRWTRLSGVWRALPEQDQRCLALRAEGLTYREIAQVLNISLGAVAASLERSLARFARADGR
jgi:RNA polymerase sigma-70 factor, ECF subfamily